MILHGDFSKNYSRVVGRCVVNKDNLVLELMESHNFRYALEEQFNVLLFVKCRRNYGYLLHLTPSGKSKSA
jgi:hypothetical protein